MVRVSALMLSVSLVSPVLAVSSAGADEKVATWTGWFSDLSCAAPSVARGDIRPNNPECVKRCLDKGAAPGSRHEQAIEAPVDVVRRHIDAVTARDTRIATQTLQDRVALFEAPTDPDQLTGSRFADQSTGEAALSVLLRRSLTEEVGGFVPVADLVAASTRTKQTTAAPGRTSLRLYRVRQGRISAIWNLVETSADATIAGNEARIRGFVKASNAGDIPGFLAHFSSDAKLWRAAADDNLVGPLSERMSTAQGRAEIIGNAFAKGPPGQAEIVDLVAVGDLVVTHDRVTLLTRVVLHQMKIYRLRDGLITHDWTAYERPG